VDRSLRRRGQLLVVVGALLGALIGTALGLIDGIENARSADVRRYSRYCCPDARLDVRDLRLAQRSGACSPRLPGPCGRHGTVRL
jgi:hypothetical protein